MILVLDERIQQVLTSFFGVASQWSIAKYGFPYESSKWLQAVLRSVSYMKSAVRPHLHMEPPSGRTWRADFRGPGAP